MSEAGATPPLTHPPSSREINFNAEHATISNSSALTEKLESRRPFESIIPDQAFQTTSTTVHELSEALELHMKANEEGTYGYHSSISPRSKKSSVIKICSDPPGRPFVVRVHKSCTEWWDRATKC